VTNTPTRTPTVTSTPVPPLGTLNLTVATGPSDYCPADTAAGSFLKIKGSPTGGIVGTVCNATRGNFSAGPIVLAGGSRDVNGIAALQVSSPVVIDSQIPSQAGNDHVCWRIEGNGQGFVDCDGGSNADATLTVSSNTTSAPPLPAWDNAWISAPASATNSGAGAALIPISLKTQSTSGACPAAADSSWNSVVAHTTYAVTGTATVTINTPRKCPGGNGTVGTCPSAAPYAVTLAGHNFTCANWTTNSGAQLVIPNAELDTDFGSVTILGSTTTFGVGDLAEVQRFND